MRRLTMLTLLLILMLPSLALSDVVTVGPDDPYALRGYWYYYGSADTILVLPGAYEVFWSPLELTSDSPSLVGVGGPEGIVLLGDGSQKAFSLGEWVNNAHIHFEHLTFRGFREIITRPSSVSGSGGHLHFADNIVEDCGGAPYTPALRATSCGGSIARNVFRDNHGPALMTYHTSAAVEDNEIYRNAHGIVDDCCNGPAIRRNRVHHNDGYGIRTGYADIEIVEDNLIENNGGIGLAVGYSGPVQDNVVRNNAVGVAATSWLGTYVSLHNNDIYDNTDANLEIRTDRTGTWDCTSNWWGTTDPAVIAEMIWDCNDDPELLICVEFDPFCTSPGCEPTAVEATTWGGVKALYRD